MIDLPAWQEDNREFLSHAIDELQARVDGEDAGPARERADAVLARMDGSPALVTLAEVFDLQAFEVDVVLLCLAGEIAPRFRIDAPPVTIGVALESLEGSHWAALDDAATLRAWGLVEVDQHDAFADAALRLAPDVVRYLMGFDPREDGSGHLRPAPAPVAVVPEQARVAAELAQTIATTAAVSGEAPAVELHGETEEERVALAVLCADALGAVVVTADVRDLPPPGPELEALLRRWSRWSRLTATLVCLVGADASDDDTSLRHRIDRALDHVRGVFFVSVARPTTVEPARPVVRRPVPPLTAEDRVAIWDECLGAVGAPEVDDGVLADLARDFRITPRTIQRACLEVEATLDEDAAVLPSRLRQACASTVRARLDPVAERVPVQDDSDIALPPREAAQLGEIEDAIRLSEQIQTQWGVGRGGARGTTALFAGPSGTGKTHAAGVVASRLGFDLFRVSLASVLSKYIGETERNLERIFDIGAVGGVILLFDEADAMFGNRSEVRDSHDRYANLGTAYLLARMERTDAPVILTTNLKDAIDPAFARRLHFIVDFPFPDEAQREQIWRMVYPPQTPVGELDPASLARVAVTGGTISNIARRAALIAAAADSPVEMQHLYEATRSELRKAGRELSPEELKAWPAYA